MNARLEVRGLRVSFGSRPVLDGLSFSAHGGEVYGLVGANGAGKTTTIKVVTGLLAPDAGEVVIEDGGRTVPACAALGWVPQEVALYRHLTVRENLEFHGALHGLSGAALSARVVDVIACARLDAVAATPVARLSGGWQRRANLAVALVHEPGVLVLDEPTAGMDLEGRRELAAIVRDVTARGAAVVLTSHDFAEVERLCDRIGLLHAGRLAAHGSLDELRRLVPAAQVAAIGTSDGRRLADHARGLGWRCTGAAGRYALWLPSAHDMAGVIARLDGVPVSSLALEPVGLEHVYEHVLGTGVS